MSQRLHTSELLGEYLRIFEVELKTALSLKSAMRGHLDWAPPEQVVNLVNGVWIAPEPIISIGRVMLPKDLQVIYNFRVVYVRRILQNENVNKVKCDEIQLIVEKLIDKYDLPDLTLSNAEVKWSFPTSIETEPPEDDLLESVADDLVSTAFNVECVVRTNHR